MMQIPGWPKLMVCLLTMQADVAHCPAEAGFGLFQEDASSPVTSVGMPYSSESKPWHL